MLFRSSGNSIEKSAFSHIGPAHYGYNWFTHENLSLVAFNPKVDHFAICHSIPSPRDGSMFYDDHDTIV